MNTPLFLANLVLTVLALGLTIHAGRSGARRRHYSLAGITVLLLAAAIWQAEMYGRDYRFDELRLDVHLTCAFGALIALPGVVISGVRLAQGGRRKTHQLWVTGFVVLTVASVLTAGWMFLSATPIAD